MRVLVDLPPDTLQKLTAISRRRRTARAAVIREALEAHVAAETRRAAPQAFGLWGSGEEGLALQRRLRAEWQASCSTRAC